MSDGVIPLPFASQDSAASLLDLFQFGAIDQQQCSDDPDASAGDGSVSFSSLFLGAQSTESQNLTASRAFFEGEETENEVLPESAEEPVDATSLVLSLLLGGPVQPVIVPTTHFALSGSQEPNLESIGESDEQSTSIPLAEVAVAEIPTLEIPISTRETVGQYSTNAAVQPAQGRPDLAAGPHGLDAVLVRNDKSIEELPPLDPQNASAEHQPTPDTASVEKPVPTGSGAVDPARGQQSELSSNERPVSNKETKVGRTTDQASVRPNATTSNEARHSQEDLGGAKESPARERFVSSKIRSDSRSEAHSASSELVLNQPVASSEGNVNTPVMPLGPSVERISGNAGPQPTPAESIVPSRPSEVASPAPTSPPAPNALEVRLGDGTAERVTVRFVDRAGQVEMSVRTPNQSLSERVKADMPELVQRLDQQGWRMEQRPSVEGGGHTLIAGSNSIETGSSASSDHSFDGRSDPNPWAGNQGRQSQQHESSRQRAWQTWIDEVENTLDGDLQGAKR